jgi:hypothetical protein
MCRCHCNLSAAAAVARTAAIHPHELFVVTQDDSLFNQTHVAIIHSFSMNRIVC